MVQFLKFISSPAGLERAVLARLNREQKRQAKIQLVIFALVDILALSGLVASVIYLSSLFAKSGFIQYLSLIVSDGGLLFSYWRELVLSLAESLPVLGLIAFLFIITVLVWSIAKTIINALVILLPV